MLPPTCAPLASRIATPRRSAAHPAASTRLTPSGSPFLRSLHGAQGFHRWSLHAQPADQPESARPGVRGSSVAARTHPFRCGGSKAGGLPSGFATPGSDRWLRDFRSSRTLARSLAAKAWAGPPPAAVGRQSLNSGAPSLLRYRRVPCPKRTLWAHPPLSPAYPTGLRGRAPAAAILE